MKGLPRSGNGWKDCLKFIKWNRTLVQTPCWWGNSWDLYFNKFGGAGTGGKEITNKWWLEKFQDKSLIKVKSYNAVYNDSYQLYVPFERIITDRRFMPSILKHSSRFDRDSHHSWQNFITDVKAISGLSSGIRRLLYKELRILMIPVLSIRLKVSPQYWSHSGLYL
jgi:hypothetical protein